MKENNQHAALTEQFGELELARQKMQQKKRMTHVFFSLVALVYIIVLTIFKLGPFGLFGIGVLAVGWIYFINRETKQFAAAFKELVMIPAIKAKFQNLTYSKVGISKQAFLSSDLFKSSEVDRYKSEDMFGGMHEKTKFKFSEVHAERRDSDSDGGSSYRTVFQGIFLIADFNKSLKGKTKVIQAWDNFFKKLISKRTQVSLEHPEFEAVFNTYSDDQVEARYILSTAMMERILHLQKKWSNKLRISFIRDHVFVAIDHNKNLFEPNLKKKINHEQLERIFDEISSCIEIMDLLDLNTRIWTKE